MASDKCGDRRRQIMGVDVDVQFAACGSNHNMSTQSSSIDSCAVYTRKPLLLLVTSCKQGIKIIRPRGFHDYENADVGRTANRMESSTVWIRGTIITKNSKNLNFHLWDAANLFFYLCALRNHLPNLLSKRVLPLIWTSAFSDTVVVKGL